MTTKLKLQPILEKHQADFAPIMPYAESKSDVSWIDLSKDNLALTTIEFDNTHAVNDFLRKNWKPEKQISFGVDTMSTEFGTNAVRCSAQTVASIWELIFGQNHSHQFSARWRGKFILFKIMRGLGITARPLFWNMNWKARNSIHFMDI